MKDCPTAAIWHLHSPLELHPNIFNIPVSYSQCRLHNCLPLRLGPDSNLAGECLWNTDDPRTLTVPPRKTLLASSILLRANVKSPSNGPNSSIHFGFDERNSWTSTQAITESTVAVNCWIFVERLFIGRPPWLNPSFGTKVLCIWVVRMIASDCNLQEMLDVV
jgi:hypothetical protein